MSSIAPAACLTPQSVDWESFLFSFRLPCPSAVEVVAVAPGGRLPVRTADENAVGRIALAGLDPEKAYEFEVRWEGGGMRLSFETLPAPRGALRSQFIAMADPHLSGKTENRKGRLFVESRSILRDIVEDANDLGVDGVLLAGDLTDTGVVSEFEWAREILAGLRCPWFAAPGDHDLRGGDAAAWLAAVGAPARIARMQGLCVVTLNTAGGFLGAEGRALLEEAIWSDARAVVVVSHMQVTPDAYIRHGKQKVIRDHDEHRDLIARLRDRTCLVYAGHQNVPSLARTGGMMQLNLPQPVQYPCGYVLVREYENGFYHTFRPIRSEALNEFSRAACNAAADRYGEPQWREEYRRGGGLAHTNFLFPASPWKQGEPAS